MPARGQKSIEFRRERQRSWKRLEHLVERVEKGGVESLRQAELMELPVLHRATLSALSVARSISLDRNLVAYLEGVTRRSYFCVYGVRRGLLETVRTFFLHRFPEAVARARWHVLVAALVTVLGVLVGFALTHADEDRYYSFVSEGMAQGRDPGATTEFLRNVLYHGGRTPVEELTAFATFLFQHNTQIGILCFALGFAFGVPVFYLLFTNGIILGAMAALYYGRGLSIDFWGWILPHGVTELLAIILCGAAGLLQAQAVLFPGRLGRLARLRIAGRQAGMIVVGCVALFFVAALIEGFLRQMSQSISLRYTVTAITAGAWLFYFVAPWRLWGRHEQ